MSLALHIFRKDVRHFRPEILINLLLLIAFAWAAPLQWTPGAGAETLLPVLLRMLLPVGWFILVSRVLHDETLVGDRQFWITRPYRWAPLLAAKVVFVILFINLPLLLMQIYLLHHAGLPVAPAAGDLLLYQLAFTAIYLLPFVALGTVTAAFGQHLLAVLAALLYGIAVAMFSGWLSDHAMFPPYLGSVLIAVSVITLAAAVLVMYARRPVLRTRVALLSLPPVLLLLVLCAPAKALIRHLYRPVSSGVLAFDPDPDNQEPGSGEPLLFGNDVLLQLPVRLTSSLSNQLIFGKGIQLTIRDADGHQWTSAYQEQQSHFSNGDTEQVKVFMLLREYQRLQAKPLDLQARVPIERVAIGQATTVVVPTAGFFPAPNGGRCLVEEDQSSPSCRFALRYPQPMQVSAQIQETPCLTMGKGAGIMGCL